MPQPVRKGAHERRRRGHELMENARRANFEGPALQALTDELWIYGMPVMLSMLRTGEINKHCAQYGHTVEIDADAREVLHTSRDERDALAFETVTAAMHFFTSKVLPQQKWDPERGASLQTYFVGALGLVFPRVYERWLTTRRKSLAIVSAALDTSFASGGSVPLLSQLDPAEFVALRDTLERILKPADSTTRAICTLIARGLTYAQIGEELHLSTAAVEARMYRLRKSTRRMARRGEIHAPAFASGTKTGTR